MTAHFDVRSQHAVRAHSVVAIGLRRPRSIPAGLACLIGGAAMAFASIVVAQPAGDAARSVPEGLASTRPVSATQAPNAKGARTKSAAAAVEYYHVAGNAFLPDDSTTTYATTGSGCRYATGGTSLRFTAPVLLPAGSTVKYLKLQFYDASVGDSLLYMMEYHYTGGSSVGFVFANSQGTAGAGEALSDAVTWVTDPQQYSYGLDWEPTVALSAQSICGALIVYYPPAPAAALCSLDADGNGAIEALSDGLLIMRAMFGLTGTAVTDNAIGSGTPSRTTWMQLRDYFNTSCGASFAQ